MRRTLPAAALALTGVWLLLQESVTPGNILLGMALSVVLLPLALRLDLPRGRLRRPLAAIELAIVVCGDIIRSNLAVARIVLGVRSGKHTSGFLRIPLEMRAPYGLAALACIVTATPGTIWVAYDSGHNSVLLHILDLVDEQVWLATIKGRYERRLMEIFE